MSHVVVGNKKTSDPNTLPGAVVLTMNLNRKASNFEFFRKIKTVFQCFKKSNSPRLKNEPLNW